MCVCVYGVVVCEYKCPLDCIHVERQADIQNVYLHFFAYSPAFSCVIPAPNDFPKGGPGGSFERNRRPFQTRCLMAAESPLSASLHSSVPPLAARRSTRHQKFRFGCMLPKPRLSSFEQESEQAGVNSAQSESELSE